LLVVMAAAVPIASAVVLVTGLQRAIWVRVAVDADRPAPPALSVVFGRDPDERLPVIWDGSATTTALGLSSNAPAKLLAIDTDRGVVPPWLAQTWGSQWERVADPSGLLIRGSGVVEMAGSFRRLTLTFEPGPASVEIGWLDQYATIDLSPQPGKVYSVDLKVPSLHRGWVLLPPTAISRMAIRSGPQVGRFSIREVSIHGPARQTWSPQPFPADAHACHATVREGAVLVDPSAAEPCDVPMDGLRPLNQLRRLTWLSIWAFITAGGFLGLHALAVAARRLNGFAANYELVESRLGQWVRERTRTWTLRRLMVGVAACTLLYHVSYVLSVPVHFTYDSLGYYAFGRNYLHTGDLGAIATCRTPGYPSLIALSILFFGDQVHALALLQHLALLGLGLLVVRVLYPIAGPLLAAIGGLLTGASPIMSVAASVVWTEAPFASVSAAALLVFLINREPGPVRLFAAGALAGIATLIRPNGLVVVVLMAGWLFLRWWCNPSKAERVSRLLWHAGAVVAAWTLIVSVWAVHVHEATGTWALTDPNCSTEVRTSRPVLSKGSHPTNIFQLAGLFNVYMQNDDIDTLAIAEPYRVFNRFFPARHRYYVGRFLPWEVIYDDRFSGEILREYVRAFRGRYLRQAGDALLFNLTDITRRNATVFVDRALEDVVNLQRTRTYPIVPKASPRLESLTQSPTISWSEAEVLLAGVSDAPAPLHSRMRSLHLRLSQSAMSMWGGIVGLSFTGLVLCLMVPGYRRFVVLAGHAAALIAAPAVIGMGVDRYAMVAEPVLYVLIVLLLSLTLQRRLRRRQAPPVPITGEIQ
jgi:hypothetical protein